MNIAGAQTKSQCYRKIVECGHIRAQTTLVYLGPPNVVAVEIQQLSDLFSEVDLLLDSQKVKIVLFCCTLNDVDITYYRLP